MKIVIAGGSGLIGRHLARRLVADDHETVILTRDTVKARRRLPTAARVVGWDPTGLRTGWAQELANSAAVVNLCGHNIGTWPWTGRTMRRVRDSRVGPTQTLVDAIASLPLPDRPRALLNASTIELYTGADSEPATESTPATDSALGRIVVDWEAAALSAEQLDVRVVLLRMGIVMAADAPALARLALPVRLFVGGPIGSGDQWFSWVGIEDAVGLILQAIRSWDLSGPLNIVAPEPVRQRDLARAIGRVLNRPTLFATPAWLVRLVLGGQATLVLDSRRVSPAKALAASHEFRQPDLEKVLRAALVSASGRRGRRAPSSRLFQPAGVRHRRGIDPG